MRTQAEIVDRMRAARDGGDFFGFAAEVLAAALDVEHVREFCKPDADLSDWTAWEHDEEIAAQASGYLTFAWGKARDHRGISADRSVTKLREFAWLLGREDIIEAMDAAEYPQYGVPKLVAFATVAGWPIPEGDGLARMAKGEPCDPNGCDDGCDS